MQEKIKLSIHLIVQTCKVKNLTPAAAHKDESNKKGINSSHFGLAWFSFVVTLCKTELFCLIYQLPQARIKDNCYKWTI